MVKQFVQAIRFPSSERMSNEYKILKKLCPVYFLKKNDPIVHLISPYKYYHDIRTASPLWVNALVRLVIDEKAENDYRNLRDHYEDIRPGYRTTKNESFLKEDRLKHQREASEIIEKEYLKTMYAEAVINSTNRKDLGLCLTFRGLLAYLFSEHELRKHIEDRKGKRKSKEGYNERAVGWRKALVKRSSTRIHEVIRNPSAIKEAPFLEGSKLFESLGFDVLGLLLQISIELIDQLHIDANTDQYLLRRATERYLAEFDRYFFDRLQGAIKKRHTMNVALSLGIPLREDEDLDSIVERIANRTSTIITLNEYRKKMALQMRTWLLNDLKEREDTINKSLEMEHALKKKSSGS